MQDSIDDINDGALQRDAFVLPTFRSFVDEGSSDIAIEDLDKPCTYLCGNSLGALPKRADEYVRQELEIWAKRGVEGHFNHPEGRPWSSTDHINPLLAELVGARTDEVACMSTLTANLHLMMNSFYKPTPSRYKILCETKAFPSDQYAFASQVTLHGLDPQNAVLELSPRSGEYTLREDDILSTIEREGASIALVLFPAVQYYSGQWFPMERITRAAKTQGCTVGWDLAHGIGNVPMALHDWDVDFAVWCTYKYLNSGPGGIAGLFVHEKWADEHKPRYAGWWGHDPATRFAMPPHFEPVRGAQGFQQSNPSALCNAALMGALEVFRDAGMLPAVRRRSVRLTGAFYERLTKSRWYVPPERAASYGFDSTGKGAQGGSKEVHPAFTIITPADPEARGAQLSLLLLPADSGLMPRVFAGLKRRGVVGDEREPDVIRLSPAPLYNTWADCERAAEVLDAVFEELTLAP
ncbi:kynureninase [Schizopora paradoxa]|uniref:Kynureninase n=1 Tax=Schizopora paradoxa TaxID=27342 RepID=A0A0H2RKV2_9AGAM|nr:kynureninase [Schizopora paradoxa]